MTTYHEAVATGPDEPTAYRTYSKEEALARAKEEADYEPIRLAELAKIAASRLLEQVTPQIMGTFASLSLDEQAEFAEAFDAVERRLVQGNIPMARAIIAGKEPKTDNGKQVQAQLVQLLDNVLLQLGM